MSEPLVEIPRSGWTELRDRFLYDYPRSIPAYYALDTQIQHPNFGTSFEVKVFCPFGDMRNGVVMLNNKGRYREVIVLPMGHQTEKLEAALIHTKLIDWSHEICVPWADTDVIKLMKRVCSRTNLKKTQAKGTIKHIVRKGTKPYENMEPPPATYTSSLKPEHIHQVDKVWPHRYATSPKFFDLLIRNGLSYGLFSTEDHSLLAWCFLSEVGFLTYLYCEEQHRGKGYAEYIAKVVFNDQLAQGKDVFGYVAESNIGSFRLFRKLETEVMSRGVWMFFKSDSVNLIEELNSQPTKVGSIEAHRMFRKHHRSAL